MKQNPIIVDYIDWEIVLKCKGNKYASEEECLKSIWTEEYANPIEHYNVDGMIRIMGQVIEQLCSIEQRAYLLDKILRSTMFTHKANLLHELYIYIMTLNIRKNTGWGKWYDLYIINHKGKYYTIEQYDEIKEVQKRR